MTSADFLSVFIPASLAINFYPGPNNIFALSTAARSGIQPSMIASLGRQAAFSLLIVALALGLGALIVASPELFLALKIAGAAFLVWLGVKMLLRPTTVVALDGAAGPSGVASSMRDEFMVAFANPKPVIVLLPFLPTLITPGHWTSVSLLGAGALFLLLEALAAFAYAVAGRRMSWIVTSPNGRLWLDRTGGISVILAAVLLLGSGIKG